MSNNLKRRNFISLLSFIFSFSFVKKTKASPSNTSISVRATKKNKEIILPKDPKPFSSVIEIESKRAFRSFTNRVINPGNEKINSEEGCVEVNDLFDGLSCSKIYLQYTGPDMGWITLS